MGKLQKTVDWIAADYGTTQLRVWMMGQDGKPVAEAVSAVDKNGQSFGKFEAALLELVAPYLDEDRLTPVFCTCILASDHGRSVASYVATPCSPPDSNASFSLKANDPRISIRVLPGVKQISPPDLMAGEAVQIAGFLRSQPDFDGVLCIPDLHTKWVHISAGEIVSFKTFMTGELLALMSQQSVLHESVTSNCWDQSVFLNAISDAMAQPQSLAAQLFAIHAGKVLSDVSAQAARSRLWGLLIGVELAGSRPYWLGQNVAIFGTGTIAQHYCSGLAEQGVPAQIVEGKDLTPAGLAAAFRIQQSGPE